MEFFGGKPLKGLILAAGMGTRLRPLTDTKPKPMLRIGGKPILEYVINTLKECNIENLVIVVGYQREQIMNYFETGFDFGVKIKYVTQENVGRTEDAILAAKDEFKNEEDFLIAHADFLVDKQMIERAIQNYLELKPGGTIAVTLVKEPQFYGIVSIDEDSQIRKIVEKPAPSTEPSMYAVAGVYVFKTKLFDVLEKSKTLDSAIQEMINAGDGVYSSIWEREWVKVRYPWDILNANRYILDKMLRGKGSFIAETARISGQAKIEGPVYIGENVIVRSGAVISGPTYIGSNSFVGTNSLIREYTTVGSNVIVGFGVELKNSVILDNTTIGRLSYIGDSIIGHGVEFGAGTQTWNIRPDHSPITMTIEEETIQVPSDKFGAVIGDSVAIGINVSIYPGKMIGSGALITPGAIINQNIPSKATVRVKQEIILEKQG